MEIGIHGSILLHRGVSAPEGDSTSSGRGMIFDRMRVTSPTGSIWVPSIATNAGDLEAVFEDRFAGGGVELAGRPSGPPCRPTKVITWICGGTSVVQPVHAVATILE